MRCRNWILGIALAAIAGTPSLGAQPPEDRTLVLLLFDGWAPTLLDHVSAPALERMRREGTWTHHMIPAFPSVSLVNQVTVSTGCWPEHHGIVSNEFLDPERGRYDHSRDADWLVGCEHLHQVAERQGVHAAALGWVGSRSTTRGKLATYVSEEKSWTDFPEDAQRAQEVIRLLHLPDTQRPRLILAYFKGPDAAAHSTGMDSEETRRAVVQSDAAVGAILAAIEGLPFHDQVTLIVTTDHGLLPAWMNVNIARILERHGIEARAVSSGATSFLYFRERRQAEEAERLLIPYYQYFKVTLKRQQPSDWHLGQNDRVGDLVVTAIPPNFIEDADRWPVWTRWLTRWGPDFLWSWLTVKAAHGYPPKTAGMPGILYAWGAGIAPGRMVVNVRAIDVHPTVCRLLGIEPGSPVDGKMATELFSGDR
jgi:predicted AlkP superfamily pyrophosphatase or phosphodiesterase